MHLNKHIKDAYMHKMPYMIDAVFIMRKVLQAVPGLYH